MTKLTSKSKAYQAARGVLGDHRKVFDSLPDALTALKTIYAAKGDASKGETWEFPKDFPTFGARVGLVDVTGDVPPLADWPEPFRTEGVMTCVSFIGQRGLKDAETGKEVNGAIGFVVYPLFPIDQIQADSSGTNWLWKVVEKEASHVGLRKIRNVGDELGNDGLAAAAMQMPISVSDYVEESTSEGLDTSAFDNVWQKFKKMLSESPATAAMVPGLPNKGEVLKCIRSKPYAEEQWGELESIGAFVFMADAMAQIIDQLRERAIADGQEFDYDSGEIRAWLAGRNERDLRSQKAQVDLTKVNFAQFMAPASAQPEQPAA